MIVLKTKKPFNPGMYDPGQTYPHIFITNFNMATIASIIEIRWEYGTLDPEQGWVSGKAGFGQQTILQNDAFYRAIAAMPAEGAKDSILMAVARECYNILAANSETAGDVVEIDITGPVAAAPASDLPASADQPSTASGSDATPSDASDTTAAPATKSARSRRG